MLVRFITDDSINNFLGFFATYTQTSSAIDCNRIINGTDDGFISSPNFPYNYAINNLDCRSSITVPNGFRVLLTFTTFQTERNFDFVEVRFRFIALKTFRNCYNKHHYVWQSQQVYNGLSVNGNALLLRESGSNIPGPIVSSGSQMLVRFTTDSSESNFLGFKAIYTKTVNTP